MGKKNMKKYIKFAGWKNGKLRNGVFCGCLQCGTGNTSKEYRNHKLNF